MRKSILLSLLIVVFCGYMVFSLSDLFGELGEKKEEKAGYDAQISEKQDNIDEKKNFLENKSEEEILEQGAYDAGYAYPSEQIFVDISGN